MSFLKRHNSADLISSSHQRVDLIVYIRAKLEHSVERSIKLGQVKIGQGKYQSTTGAVTAVSQILHTTYYLAVWPIFNVS